MTITKLFFKSIAATIALSIVAITGGCKREEEQRPSQVLKVPNGQYGATDLDQNGVFLQNWEVIADDSRDASQTAAKYVKANLVLRGAMHGEIKDSAVDRIEAWVIPITQGYQVLLSSRRRLTDSEIALIHSMAADAISARPSEATHSK
jgi:hypothetical protein